MPVKLERELKARAGKMKRAGKRVDEDAYVYGTLRKTGWKPEREKNSHPRKSRRGR